MNVLEGRSAREVRLARNGLGLVGGFAAGLLLVNEQYLAGAGLAVAAVLGTVLLPRLASGPVTDERTDARERWASAATMRAVCCSYVAAIALGSVAVAAGELQVTGEMIGAFLGLGAVSLAYMLALGYAHLAGKP